MDSLITNLFSVCLVLIPPFIKEVASRPEDFEIPICEFKKNKMKKTKLTIKIAICAVSLFIAIPIAFAAVTAISMSPINVSVVAGQTFSVNLSLKPQESKIFTAKVALGFPADLIEVQSFTLGNKWMALSQDGYDLVDNTNGSFIKTAGYPKGVSSEADFGSITFKAKKSGSGYISLNSESLALDENNKNVLSPMLIRTFVNIANAPVKTAPKILPVPSETVTATSEATSTATTTVVATTGIDNQTGKSLTLTASIANIITLGTDSITVGIVVIVLILGALAYLLFFRKRKHGFGY